MYNFPWLYRPAEIAQYMQGLIAKLLFHHHRKCEESRNENYRFLTCFSATSGIKRNMLLWSRL